MAELMRPVDRPANPCFSSGPCTKRPGWSLRNLQDAPLGRSHRAQVGKARLKAAIDETRDLLRLPSDYRVGIMAASDTGAFEAAMWSMLGERGVDVLAWESFGKGWVNDVVKQLKLDDVNVLDADYGNLPDLSRVDMTRDVIFTWNGTTSGVRVPNGDWISNNRSGLTFCDATSAAFAQDIEWEKIDVATFSWQKVLGGEAQHGVLILSPRAIQRLTHYTAPWPLPKIFRLTKGGKLIDGIFEGATINTPSMLCVEDYLDALCWGRNIGGLDALIARADKNASVVTEWVEKTTWIDFLAAAPEMRSNTSVCLRFVGPALKVLDSAAQASFAKGVVQRLELEGVAFDIGAYRDAPPGLRIWTGSTVESVDLEALMPWIEWAYAELQAQI